MRYLLLLLALLLAGCAARSAPQMEPAVPITDTAYLTAPLWDDGRAEVAFYEVQRSQNQYGQPDDQQFLVGTYVVKHDFDPAAMTKAVGGARGVPAFKYAFFYEFESGSYEYKRNWVANVARADLRPFKQSFTSFDWCSNRYEELAVQPDGTVRMLARSDDYGNAADAFPYRPNAFPVAAVPLLVRGLDFSEREEHDFEVVLPDGRYIEATARLEGVEAVQTAAGEQQAERIAVAYAEPVPSLVAEESDTDETYWRGTGPERLLLRLEGGSGRYRMTLVEQLRSPYWSENFWPTLARIDERP